MRISALGALAVVVFVVTASLVFASYTTMSSAADGARAADAVGRTTADAYEQWTLDDDQSNMYAALAALRDPSQSALMATTWGQALSARDAAHADVANLRQGRPDAAVSRLIDRIEADLTSYDGFTRQLGAAVTAGDISRAVHVVTVDNLQPSNDLPLAFGALTKLEQQRAASDATRMHAAASSGRTQVLLLALIGTGLIAGGTWLVIRSLRGPMTSVLTVLDAAAEGDLTSTVPDLGDDAVGRMARAADRLLERTRDSLAAIGAEGRALGEASAALTATSTALDAATASSQARTGEVATSATAVGEATVSVASAVEEMHCSVAEIARSASHATGVAADSVRMAEDAARTVAQLQDSSREIGEVLTLISDIARQTNLLALNASIEAARAGSLGKGFAVVADEVKTLAVESQRAVEGVQAKISAVQSEVADAVAAMARVGTTISDVQQAQLTISAAVEEQSATLAEVSRSLSTAADGGTAIAGNVAELRAGAEGSATLAAEVLASARDLDATAERLSQLVAGFRLGI